MWEATADILETSRNDDDVRVVVITGAGGKAFVSGADISQVRERARHAGGGRALQRDRRARPIDASTSFPKPTIAMIRGYCIGGGLGLAVCCDLRICSDDSQVRRAGGEARARLRLSRPASGWSTWSARRSPRRSSSPRASSTPTRRARWASSTASCRRTSSRAYVKNYADTIAGNAPLTVKAVKFIVGEAVQGREQARPRARQRDGRRLLRQQGLHRRPPRLHGEAQAGVHGDVKRVSLAERQRAKRASLDPCLRRHARATPALPAG